VGADAHPGDDALPGDVWYRLYASSEFIMMYVGHTLRIAPVTVSDIGSDYRSTEWSEA